MVEKFEEPIYVTRPLLPSIPKMMAKIEEIWASKWLTNDGEQQRHLERELKEYLNVDHLSLFANGTLALLLGLKSLELTGEVITTPFTFPATIQALEWNGLTPVFCDIDATTLTIDATKIEALINEKTTAILAVHVFGNPCDVKKIQEIADDHQLKVIYDGAHAFGTQLAGKSIGRFGDMTMYSFHATKLFNTIEGGALTFKNPLHVDKLYALKNFGLEKSGDVVHSGLNAKMNEVQAAMGREVLPLMEQEKARREKIAEIYKKRLTDIAGIKIVTHLEKQCSSYQYFVIEIDAGIFGESRDWVHEQLKHYNIFTRKYFEPLCSEFEWYKLLASSQRQHLPQAHKTVSEVLALPFYGELDLASVEKICDIVKQLRNDVTGLEKQQLGVVK